MTPEISPGDISGVMTKAPYEVSGIHGRQERREICDVVLHIFVFARRRGVLWNKTALLTLARLSLRADADGRWQHGTKAALFTLARRSLRAGAVVYETKLLCLHLRASPCAQARTGGYRKQNKKCDCLKQKKVIE